MTEKSWRVTFWFLVEDALRRIAREAIAAQAERDKAYRERAALVAYLSACYPSVIASAPDAEGWAIVYVGTPSGQMSWHIAHADTGLFAHLAQDDAATWDGHTTEEKYQRLAELTSTVATGAYGPQPAPELAADEVPAGFEGTGDGDDRADYAELCADRDRLREFLAEVGTLAANAPEDGAFSVCEDIAMRIAAFGVPDDGRHPDGCACQFCREDEREERDREDRQDRDEDDEAERADVLRARAEIAYEAGDDRDSDDGSRM